MHPPENFERIVNRKKYSTKTATLIASDEYWDGSNFERHERNQFLYRTPGGGYFTINLTQWQGERNSLEPIDQAEAITLYESLPEYNVDFADAFPGVNVRTPDTNIQCFIQNPTAPAVSHASAVLRRRTMNAKAAFENNFVILVGNDQGVIVKNADGELEVATAQHGFVPIGPTDEAQIASRNKQWFDLEPLEDRSRRLRSYDTIVK